MKIYLAARYARYAEMQVYRGELEALGHTVTSRWIEGDHEIDGEDPDPDECIRLALEDLIDLADADTLVCFTEEPGASFEKGNRGGRHVEFGVALSADKRIIVVGYRENAFYYMPEVKFFNSWDAAKESIGDAYDKS